MVNIRSMMHSFLPCSAAAINGVLPLSATALGSAPFSMSISAISADPKRKITTWFV